MKPCRDCGAPAAPSARACPGCGILNPVLHWVSLPGGEHLNTREHPRSVPSLAPAFAMPAGAAATLALPSGSRAHRSTGGLGRYFSGVYGRDEADEAIRDCSKGFFFIAALTGAVGVFLGAGMLLDAALLAGLAFWMRSRSSQVAALLLLLLAALGIVSTVMARMGMAEGGRNVFLALITFGMAWRSVMATRVLGRLGPAAA